MLVLFGVSNVEAALFVDGECSLLCWHEHLCGYSQQRTWISVVAVMPIEVRVF